MWRGGGGKKRRVGVKDISDWLEGGGAKPFIKKFRGCLQFEVHFKSGPLSKVGKTVKSRAQAGKQYMWNSNVKFYKFVLILGFCFV